MDDLVVAILLGSSLNAAAIVVIGRHWLEWRGTRRPTVSCPVGEPATAEAPTCPWQRVAELQKARADANARLYLDHLRNHHGQAA